jgi:hypothetical protein
VNAPPPPTVLVAHVENSIIFPPHFETRL